MSYQAFVLLGLVVILTSCKTNKPEDSSTKDVIYAGGEQVKYYRGIEFENIPTSGDKAISDYLASKGFSNQENCIGEISFSMPTSNQVRYLIAVKREPCTYSNRDYINAPYYFQRMPIKNMTSVYGLYLSDFSGKVLNEKPFGTIQGTKIGCLCWGSCWNTDGTGDTDYKQQCDIVIGNKGEIRSINMLSTAK